MDSGQNGQSGEVLTCYKHPRTETRLRCNKCARPVCGKCIVRTPVGYRCRECVNVQQRAFYAGFRPVYYFVALIVALPLALVAGWLIPRLGWYTIFLGPLVGVGIAEATRWATRRKRGQYTWLVVCGSIVVGALPNLLTSLVLLFAFGGSTSGGPGYLPVGTIRLLWGVIYVLMATGAAYARLRGVTRP